MGAALSALFVFWAVEGVVRGRFTPGRLALMACVAGLALNTRVSMGVGCYAAIGLVMARQLLIRPWPDAIRTLLPAAAVLALFVGIAGFVNYERWGNPATFVDFSAHLMSRPHPELLARIRRYGMFNVERIPFAFFYYFVPIWALNSSDGTLVLGAHRYRLIETAELPPGSFFLSDPLPLLLVAVLVVVAIRGRRLAALGPPAAWLLAAGLAVPAALMMTAMSMTYRYRCDFYLLLDFATLMAYRQIAGGVLPAGTWARLRPWAIAATLVGIGYAHLAALLYMISPFGSLSAPFEDNIIGYYGHFLVRIFHALGL